MTVNASSPDQAPLGPVPEATSSVSVAIYKPDPADPTSGDILYCKTAPASVIAKLTAPHVVVSEHRRDWDVTHKVVGGAVTARPQGETEARRGVHSPRMAMLRKRDALMIEMNLKISPFDYEDMTDAQRGAWRAYRQALKDIEKTADPSSPVWPEPPTA